jgi:serine/threonine-protein kinase RsbW
MSYQATPDVNHITDNNDPSSNRGLASDLQSNSASADTIMVDIPADLRYVNILGAAVSAFVANIGGLVDREATLYNLELAIQELSVNITTHAYAICPGRIRMSAALSHPLQQITIILHDTGTSFNPTEVPDPTLGELQEHGYGLFLVHQLIDEVEYMPTDGENIWKLIKNLPIRGDA